jgi:8-oxo-dGTP pyrophosphatase MutT (NUDIX family)
MYKVFVENRELIFTQESTLQGMVFESKALRGENRISQLQSIIDLIDIGDRIEIICDKPKKVFNDFFGSYKSIEAAGGIVRRFDEFLFIQRFGLWDLPKGKIEKGESPEFAALREVEEECGITGVVLHDSICETYHTYEMKGKNILKKTYWYNMSYTGDQALTPQLEEGITDVRWIKLSEVDEILKNTYPSIRYVFAEATK